MVRTKIYEHIEQVPNMKLHHTLIMVIPHHGLRKATAQHVGRPLNDRYFPSLTKNVLLLGMCNFVCYLLPCCWMGGRPSPSWWQGSPSWDRQQFQWRTFCATVVYLINNLLFHEVNTQSYHTFASHLCGPPLVVRLSIENVNYSDNK